MYDYDEFESYYDPSEADEIVIEYQEKMKEVLLKGIKNDIKNTTSENERLKEENKKLKDRERDVDNKERQLEYQKSNLFQEVKRERLSQVLENFQVIMYRASTTTKKLPKCNKCNDNRKIEFKSPSGKTMTESCECDKGIAFYVPNEYICTEFRMDDNNKRLLAWYKLHRNSGDDDYYQYDSTNLIKTLYDNNMNYNELDYYHTYFKDKKECEKYCDWLNNQSKED